MKNVVTGGNYNLLAGRSARLQSEEDIDQIRFEQALGTDGRSIE